MQWLLTVVFSVLVCVVYGVVHDQITARIFGGIILSSGCGGRGGERSHEIQRYQDGCRVRRAVRMRPGGDGHRRRPAPPLRCPGCGKPVTMHNLSALRKLLPARHVRRSGRFQYGLGDLLLLTTGLVLVLAFVQTAGPALVLAIVIAVTIVIVVITVFAGPWVLLYILCRGVTSSFWDRREQIRRGERDRGHKG